MAREEPPEPPSSREQRPPKKDAEVRRRVAIGEREREEARTERDKKWRGSCGREWFNGETSRGGAGGKKFFVVAPREKMEPRNIQLLLRIRENAPPGFSADSLVSGV